MLPTLALLLASSQEWFRDLQPWVDFDYAQNPLLDGALNAQHWTHLAVTALISHFTRCTGKMATAAISAHTPATAYMARQP